MRIKLVGAMLACILVGTAAIGAERAATRRFEGNLKALGAFKELALEVGYKPEQIRIVRNGERVKVA